ncbi:hypothetical protein GGF38_000741 [Coemansia sp. RSA 25]|nr:hypothetical protein GGF38_000741 [Coemansia sp. RSA 25]
MLAKLALLATFAAVSVVAESSALVAVDPTPLQQLRCLTAPRESALLVRAYSDRDVIYLQCQTTGGPTVDRTTNWVRTGDDCYVPAYYVALDDASRQSLPSCVTIDDANPCILPNIDGFDLLERAEGFLERPRGDIITGLAYVGFGHQCTSAKCDQEPASVPSFPMSRDQARVLLWQDVRNATACLTRMLTAGSRTASLVLSDNMWSALVSWTFSIGCDVAAQSQLIRRLQNGEPPIAVVSTELPKWTAIHGKSMAELVARRSAELTLFRTRSASMAYPRCDQQISK